jgi:hypothetical protein
MWLFSEVTFNKSEDHATRYIDASLGVLAARIADLTCARKKIVSDGMERRLITTQIMLVLLRLINAI